MAALAGFAMSGCGDSKTGPVKPPPGTSQSAFDRQLRDAASPRSEDFPLTARRSLKDMTVTITNGSRVVLGNSVFVPGRSRIAFGVIDTQNRFVYGKTAIYLARSPNSRARGPFLAPADTLVTKPRYRSRQAAADGSGIAAIYAADVDLPATKAQWMLVVTRTERGLQAGALHVPITRSDEVPQVGERPPAVDTDTIASTRGNESLVDTRIPPAPELHRSSFKDVLGTKPVALLFATPQLCQSRVCGPVVDIALQVKAEFGDRVEFIHQEVFNDNRIDAGLRPPLEAFRLPSEPWLFTFTEDGRVAARLEGSFGVEAFRSAVRAAIE